jgi:hypothetical protein
MFSTSSSYETIFRIDIGQEEVVGWAATRYIRLIHQDKKIPYRYCTGAGKNFALGYLFQEELRIRI